jgi:thiamine biosynthesis lipoprotein
MKKIVLSCLLAIVLFLTSCAMQSEYKSSNFFVMDTLAEIRVYESNTYLDNVFSECKQLAHMLEGKISVTLEGSDTIAFNEQTSFAFSSEFLELLALSKVLSEYTDGYFDATCGALISLWKSCETQNRFPTEQELADAKAAVGYSNVVLADNGAAKNVPALMLDFGAIGKGFAADKMAESLKKNGAECGMISFVSSVTVFGDKDFNIGIRCPNTSGELLGYVSLNNRSLSVSGDYERFYEIGGEHYPHILDPKTGCPVKGDIHSVAVIADSGAVADALSTAIFAMGIREAAALYQNGELSFEFLCITDTDVVVSDGFSEKLNVTNKDYRLCSVSQYLLEN